MILETVGFYYCISIMDQYNLLALRDVPNYSGQHLLVIRVDELERHFKAVDDEMVRLLTSKYGTFFGFLSSGNFYEHELFRAQCYANTMYGYIADGYPRLATQLAPDALVYLVVVDQHPSNIVVPVNGIYKWAQPFKAQCIADANKVNVVHPGQPLYINDKRPLSIEMMQLYKSLQPSLTTLASHDSIISTLNKMLNKAWPGKRFMAEKFGSSLSGLLLEGSDLDLCIVLPNDQENMTRYQEMTNSSETVFDVAYLARLLRAAGMDQVEPIHAIVPICKFVDPHTKLHCDLSIHNTLAIANSHLIKAYTALDDRVRPILFMVKHFVKRRHINDAADGTLSSYTYSILCLQYLIHQKVVVNLQQLSKLSCTSSKCALLQEVPHRKYLYRGKPTAFNTFHHQCVRPVYKSSVKRPASDKENTYFPSVNQADIAELVMGFFAYMANFDFTRSAIRLHHKLAPRRDQMRNPIVVYDPFIRNRNIANTCTFMGLRTIQSEFAQAHRSLALGKSFQEVCSVLDPQARPHDPDSVRNRRASDEAQTLGRPNKNNFNNNNYYNNNNSNNNKGKARVNGTGISSKDDHGEEEQAMILELRCIVTEYNMKYKEISLAREAGRLTLAQAQVAESAAYAEFQDATLTLEQTYRRIKAEYRELLSYAREDEEWVKMELSDMFGLSRVLGNFQYAATPSPASAPASTVPTREPTPQDDKKQPSTPPPAPVAAAKKSSSTKTKKETPAQPRFFGPPRPPGMIPVDTPVPDTPAAKPKPKPKVQQPPAPAPAPAAPAPALTTPRAPSADQLPIGSPKSASESEKTAETPPAPIHPTTSKPDQPSPRPSTPSNSSNSSDSSNAPMPAEPPAAAPHGTMSEPVPRAEDVPLPKDVSKPNDIASEAPNQPNQPNQPSVPFVIDDQYAATDPEDDEFYTEDELASYSEYSEEFEEDDADSDEFDVSGYVRTPFEFTQSADWQLAACLQSSNIVPFVLDEAYAVTDPEDDEFNADDELTTDDEYADEEFNEVDVDSDDSDEFDVSGFVRTPYAWTFYEWKDEFMAGVKRLDNPKIWKKSAVAKDASKAQEKLKEEPKEEPKELSKTESTAAEPLPFVMDDQFAHTDPDDDEFHTEDELSSCDEYSEEFEDDAPDSEHDDDEVDTKEATKSPVSNEIDVANAVDAAAKPAQPVEDKKKPLAVDECTDDSDSDWTDEEDDKIRLGGNICSTKAGEKNKKRVMKMLPADRAQWTYEGVMTHVTNLGKSRKTVPNVIFEAIGYHFKRGVSLNAKLKSSAGLQLADLEKLFGAILPKDAAANTITVPMSCALVCLMWWIVISATPNDLDRFDRLFNIHKIHEQWVAKHHAAERGKFPSFESIHDHFIGSDSLFHTSKHGTLVSDVAKLVSPTKIAALVQTFAVPKKKSPAKASDAPMPSNGIPTTSTSAASSQKDITGKRSRESYENGVSEHPISHQNVEKAALASNSQPKGKHPEAKDAQPLKMQPPVLNATAHETVQDELAFLLCNVPLEIDRLELFLQLRKYGNITRCNLESTSNGSNQWDVAFTMLKSDLPETFHF
ncbi:hypothetical protein BC940DRAFT_313500 [Gongronella butleri]|nr:hypothetical protein BC940DRAFT_313500 [Gongronella butleri]